MYNRKAPSATTVITKSAVGKITSATTTLPPRGRGQDHKLTREILAFGAKALFDYASKKC
jgi:hypothetical protein